MIWDRLKPSPSNSIASAPRVLGLRSARKQEAIALGGRYFGNAEVDLPDPQVHAKELPRDEEILVGQLRGSDDDD